MASHSKVYFLADGVDFKLAQSKRLKEAVQLLFETEGRILESMGYVFCSDKVLRRINRQYLKHDYYTDIVTFDLSDKNGVIGEAYVSIERVRKNARRLDLPFLHELVRVIFHGALHLCGYDDKSEKARKKMREKEEEYLAPFLERST